MSVFASFDEKLSEKFSLVYDYNFSSPLFVHRAAAEIEKNNLDQAAEILSKGLKQYPYYPTAYIFLARVLALQTHYDEAIENLRRAAYLCGNDALVSHYKKEIEVIKKRRSPFEMSRKNTFIENPDAAFLEEEPTVQHEQHSSSDAMVTPAQVEEPDLAVLAKKIEGAKLPPLPPPAQPQPEVAPQLESEQSFDANIVSETLAKIYFAQGKLTEALSLYEQLIKKEPHNRGRYKQAILEIKSLLSEQKKG